MRRRENDTEQALQSARKHRINPTADPIPVGDQPKNRQGARSHHPGQPARHRRRGHRIRMHLLRCMGPFLAPSSDRLGSALCPVSKVLRTYHETIE
jgi:hypothetical protein